MYVLFYPLRVCTKPDVVIVAQAYLGKTEELVVLRGRDLTLVSVTVQNVQALIINQHKNLFAFVFRPLRS